MAILGIDTSNHNHVNGAQINWPQVGASGHQFAILKATEGIGFRDGWLDRDRAGAHAAGLLVGLYHFARSGDPAAQARYFLDAVGPLRVGEFVVLDDEDPAINPAWVKTWCDTVYAATGVKPLVYMNQNYRDTQDWSAVVADNVALWLARYDGSTAMSPGGQFGSPAMKQYSDSGVVAGIAGQVDLDVFYGTADQLAKYGLQPSGGFLMALTDAEQAEIRDRIRGISWPDAGPPFAPRDSASVQMIGGYVAELHDTVIPNIAAQVAELKTAGTPVIDEVKLAAALLADPAGVDKLGAAIAAHLQLSPRN